MHQHIAFPWSINATFSDLTRAPSRIKIYHRYAIDAQIRRDILVQVAKSGRVHHRRVPVRWIRCSVVTTGSSGTSILRLAEHQNLVFVFAVFLLYSFCHKKSMLEQVIRLYHTNKTTFSLYTQFKFIELFPQFHPQQFKMWCKYRRRTEILSAQRLHGLAWVQRSGMRSWCGARLGSSTMLSEWCEWKISSERVNVTSVEVS